MRPRFRQDRRAWGGRVAVRYGSRGSGSRVSAVSAEPLPDSAGSASRRPATEAEARALASTLRVRILRLCLDEARTNKEIAAKLERNPGSVLHHVRRLVKTGFLRPEGERTGPRGSREVPYRATRKSWNLEVDPDVSQNEAMLRAFFQEVRDSDPAHTQLSRLGLRLGEDERLEFMNRVQALLDEFADRPPVPGGTPYSVFFALHPDRR